jgi:hypothetical protein
MDPIGNLMIAHCPGHGSRREGDWGSGKQCCPMDRASLCARQQVEWEERSPGWRDIKRPVARRGTPCRSRGISTMARDWCTPARRHGALAAAAGAAFDCAAGH